MKFILNFKDGLKVEVPDFDKVNGGENFIDLLKHYQKEDSPITLEQTDGNIVRNFSELHSVEIVF
ncbi:hypothetical protein COI41_14250 [Bacillus toyonensis]|uniref:hypothetical protein n=1 Tax=Bacillus toyonensis TaxID=155322 RepID=UPI000BF10455|nr:hypothetical protein [Bacillus toyonensis]MDF9451098.1 hypothetical protein [Bacillus toyonensis]MDG1561644.1 hypothetical protein [Bacillus toyonensis]PEO62742.1 hypothetical protein CN567_19900 [Bacillus toyonensis]PFX78134.1 hypothetical protein COL37_25175 [Bacillus toyonensis]PFX79183.1 hypothetical protein COL38_20055 [Bacillus toyonensis]